MNCPHCRANLAHINGAGEPMVRNHGLVFKSTGICFVCPKCRGDVAMPATLAKALNDRLVLFFRRAS